MWSLVLRDEWNETWNIKNKKVEPHHQLIPPSSTGGGLSGGNDDDRPCSLWICGLHLITGLSPRWLRVLYFLRPQQTAGGRQRAGASRRSSTSLLVVVLWYQYDMCCCPQTHNPLHQQTLIITCWHVWPWIKAQYLKTKTSAPSLYLTIGSQTGPRRLSSSRFLLAWGTEGNSHSNVLMCQHELFLSRNTNNAFYSCF